MKSRLLRLGLLAWVAISLAGCAPSPAATPTPPSEPRQAVPVTAIKRSPATDATPPQVEAEGWSPPIPLPGPVNTAGAEDSPFVSPDGQLLFYFFTPDLTIPAERQVLDGVTGIYAATLGPDGWQNPQRMLLQRRDRLALDGCPFYQDARLWFCSAREGNYRGVDIWTAAWRGGAWTDIVNAGELLNQDYGIGEMHLAPDGSTMYFHKPAADDGDLDIWLTRRLGDSWSDPQAVGAVKTPADEGWPFVSPDGAELWFTRTYQGSPAIFRSTRSGDAWSEPQRIVSTFAGEPTLDGAGNLIFVHHYVEHGALVEADLYITYRQQP